MRIQPDIPVHGQSPVGVVFRRLSNIPECPPLQEIAKILLRDSLRIVPPPVTDALPL